MLELTQGIKQSLKQVIAKEQGKTYHTGELRVLDLATDCLKEIERLEKENKNLKECVFREQRNGGEFVESEGE